MTNEQHWTKTETDLMKRAVKQIVLTHRAEPDDPRWACADCGKNTMVDPKDYYMVEDHIWESTGVGKGMLCMGCMETRLGRPLEAKDIIPCALTEVINPYIKKILGL